MSKLLCLGTGYTARQLALRLRGEGWATAGTFRRPEDGEHLGSAGIVPVPFDASNPGHDNGKELEHALEDVTHIVVSIPPDPESDKDEPTLAAIEKFFATASALQWIGYLSTVGIYGDHNGEWVDEDSDPTPVSRRSIARLAAERSWQAAAQDSAWRLQIFRLAGIYGPRRSPLDRLRDGSARRIIKPDQVFNRIHVDDIVTSLVAGMRGAGRHEIYNVTDNEPAPPQDVILHAAKLLGRTPPPEVPFEMADLSPMARSFYGENKRVRNDRLRTDLGVTLAYPTYREGLAALL